jgi:hypothetical protein
MNDQEMIQPANIQTDMLADLPVVDDQTEEVKGGQDKIYYVGSANGGVWK